MADAPHHVEDRSLHVALAVLRQRMDSHEHLCEERVEGDVQWRQHIEGMVAKISEANAQSFADFKVAHEKSVREIKDLVSSFFKKQGNTNRDLYGRWWWLVVTYAGFVTAALAYMIKHALGW